MVHTGVHWQPHDPYSDVALVSADGKGELVNLTNSGYFSASPRWVMDGNAILFATDRYGMRSHASWGSQEDVMLVFMNQDAYDKFRLSKEDYELQKELEKEQKKESEKDADSKDKKKKEDGDKKESDKVKEVVVELDGIQDRIVRLTPNSSDLALPFFPRMVRNCIIWLHSKAVMTCGRLISASAT